MQDFSENTKQKWIINLFLNASTEAASLGINLSFQCLKELAL